MKKQTPEKNPTEICPRLGAIRPQTVIHLDLLAWPFVYKRSFTCVPRWEILFYGNRGIANSDRGWLESRVFLELTVDGQYLQFQQECGGWKKKQAANYVAWILGIVLQKEERWRIKMENWLNAIKQLCSRFLSGAFGFFRGLIYFGWGYFYLGGFGFVSAGKSWGWKIKEPSKGWFLFGSYLNTS